ncbi:hypothetical protein B0J11DRAFT_480784 [Dendryphion nanum]|uniref:Ribosome biogenesis protein YTM1 n=1 Tax=Dendryphion nanum TaxID=256645 RepID=A0A9P9ITM0_9PLEO|nr:hypothetical protein B0J11DRAFT_480784 [Dendryphion nanum]
MPSQVPDQELGDAVLQSVEHGTFPQSEHVASATVPSTALPKLLEVVGKAREDTKNEIRKLSREAASDVDGWIAQARRLQDDIKRSKETAHEIVKQAEAGKDHTARVQDTASKVSFLYSEITYNENLKHVVEQLRDISTLLEAAQDAAVHGHVMHALERLEDVDSAFKQLGSFETTRVVGVLKSRAEQLRAAIVETTTESWNGLIIIEPAEKRITLKDEFERETTIQIQTVVDALTKLGLFDSFIKRLSQDFSNVVIFPRFVFGSDQVVSGFDIEGDDIQISGRVKNISVRAALEDIQSIGEYLSTRLPPSVAVPLSHKLIPVIASRLISNWLLPAVPLSTDGVLDFQETLSLVLGLAEYFDELQWTGQQQLRDWVDESAQIWLSRRTEAALARVHALCPRRVRDKKIVERVETQVVTKGDAVLGKKQEQEEDWGAWGDDEEPTADSQPVQPQEEVEEEDMSAWGMDEDEEEKKEDTKPDASDGKKGSEDTEEDGDAWDAWGDDEETQADSPVKPSAKATDRSKSNGQGEGLQKKSADKELTLRETYTVTAIPDSIVEIIMQTISDVGTLNQPDLVTTMIAPASAGLYAIPSLLLAMYRATAASHYSHQIAGDMLIYNDCQRLSDRLRTYLQEQAEKDQFSTLPHHLRPSIRLQLQDDLKLIEGFGKRAYGREMESQRTIVRDLLDGTNGFTNCTVAHFAAECDNAIAMTIDRITEVKREWQNVLSHSALLQSLGSLVSTALTKFINEVEEMSDIAEEESKKIHSYCVSLSSLSTLFQTENDAGEPQDMTSIYTPNWFKFQYLGEILDSSLADIRYFWTDGELKLEMDGEEVIDLIKALFAESEHRRKAISEIRRTTLRRINLSQLVNNLLHTSKPVPFEFLVNGQYLRTSIEEWLTQNAVSAETVLAVEYVRALVPPKKVTSFEHDDWVSAVDILSATSPAGQWSKGTTVQSGQERILSASYDGLVRVWDMSGDVLATSQPPNNGGRITSLKSAKWISEKKLAAAGMDGVVRLFKYDEDTRTITSTLELYSHRWPVESLAVHTPSNRLLSASADTTISLFSLSAKDSPAAPATLLPSSTSASNKRQKLSKPTHTVPARGALSTLTGHGAPVSSIIFKPNDSTVAYSASHDHTLRTWDLPTSTCVDTRTTGHSLLSLTALPKLSLLATGTSARHITLIDPRASATKISITTLRGHANGVVSLANDPDNEYRLVSGSHDGTARIWDLRGVGEGQSGAPVYTIYRDGMDEVVRGSGEGVKIFGVEWQREVGIVSAGEDKKVQINRAD